MAIIVFSIPLFFALIGLELAYGAATGKKLARLNDSITDLSCGILSQISGLLIKLLTVAIYAWIQGHLAVQRWLPGIPAWPSGSPFAFGDGFPWIEVRGVELASWAVVFVLVDFAYYWSHRKSHEVNLLWAGHVVHHSSEEYNLTVALRQSAIHDLMTWIFYVPLALIGVPWTMWVACYALNLVYQFWIHTRAVGRLGAAVERVLNTPSHHRVHHGVNPQYQDRNYAGVFITWDRLFGTFEPEGEEPVYGITKPLRSWNPLWANVHVLWDIGRNAVRARRWRDRLGYVLGPPGWRPAAEGGRVSAAAVSRETFQVWDPPVTRRLGRYCLAQFVVAVAATFVLLRSAGSLAPLVLAAAGIALTISLTGIGGVLERAGWSVSLETARHAALGAGAAAAWAAGMLGAATGAALVLFCGASIAWLVASRRGLAGHASAQVRTGGSA